MTSFGKFLWEVSIATFNIPIVFRFSVKGNGVFAGAIDQHVCVCALAVSCLATTVTTKVCEVALVGEPRRGAVMNWQTCGPLYTACALHVGYYKLLQLWMCVRAALVSQNMISYTSLITSISDAISSFPEPRQHEQMASTSPWNSAMQVFMVCRNCMYIHAQYWITSNGLNGAKPFDL